MYEIKEFYGKDILRYKEICCELFKSSNKNLENPEEYAAELETAEANRNEDFVRLGAFSDGKLYAAMELLPYIVNFDGTPMKMSGIAGVVSLFNSPFKGAVKEIYKNAFKIMREKKQYISHLYPFNANYYRQYGYDVTCSRVYWNIPIEYIPKSFGETVFYDGSDKMNKEIISIYESFSSRYNMMMIRDNNYWERFFKNNKPYISNVFRYIHYTEGIADAYMSYKVTPSGPRPQDFSIDTIWFSSYKGLKGILSYFLTQKAYGDRVNMNLPNDVDLATVVEFIGGWGKRNTEVSFTNEGTTRIVDVAEILKYAKCKGEGEITIKITKDEYCPWNEGCFTLNFGKENIVTIGGEPDVEMDINAFSSLILGRCDIEQAQIFDSFKILKNEDAVKHVFYKKTCFTEVHF